MGRILAIDYGKKRVGLAVSDPTGIIAGPLETVEARNAEKFIIDYCAANQVDTIVIGMPIQMNGEPSESQAFILPFVEKLKRSIPHIPIEFADERFTSKIALRAMIDSGMKKMERRNKANVDKIAAVIILQDWLECKRFNKL